MTTTYYRDDAVHISSEGVRVGNAWYPLASLTYVWHRRTGRFRHGAYMLVSRGGAVAVVVALLIAAGMAARRINFDADRTLYVAGAVLAIVLLGGIAAFSVEGLLDLVDRAHDHGKGVHEIWVRTGGDETMIYSTSDSPRFGQIYRALQRAIERGF